MPKDWRNDPNVLNPIKYQGICSSSYAFAAIAAMESAHAIKSDDKILYNLSEQQIVSCTNLYGCFGCRGGHVYKAFDYAIQTLIMSQADYPYVSGNTSISGGCVNKIEKGILGVKE